MSPGPNVRERDLAAVGVLADRARVAGADDVARVGVVALAEDDLAGREAARDRDLGHAPRSSAAELLEDRDAAEQRGGVLGARGHRPGHTTAPRGSALDHSVSSARSRRRARRPGAPASQASSRDERERQQRRRAATSSDAGGDLEHAPRVVAARRRASSVAAAAGAPALRSATSVDVDGREARAVLDARERRASRRRSARETIAQARADAARSRSVVVALAELRAAGCARSARASSRRSRAETTLDGDVLRSPACARARCRAATGARARVCSRALGMRSSNVAARARGDARGGDEAADGVGHARITPSATSSTSRGRGGERELRPSARRSGARARRCAASRCRRRRGRRRRRASAGWSARLADRRRRCRSRRCRSARRRPRRSAAAAGAVAAGRRRSSPRRRPTIADARRRRRRGHGRAQGGVSRARRADAGTARALVRPRGKPRAPASSSARAKAGSGRGALVAQERGELGQVGEVGVDRLAGERGVERRRARGQLAGEGRQACSSMAFRSFVDGAVQQRAGVGDADAEHRGQLGVVEAGVELERDQLALARARARRARRAPRRGAARARRRPRARRVGVGRLGGRGVARALAAAQLVERGVAGDAEQPRALVPRRGVVACAACGRRARTRCAVTSSAAARSRSSVAT